MKKIFINELETDKRNELIKKNSKLMQRLGEYLHEDQLFQQGEAFDLIMNKEAQKAIQYHDNYNSFYYTLENWRKFIINIDKDYLSSDAEKIYNHIMEKIETLDNMDPYSENYYNLDEHLEEETKKVLEDVEDYLHSFEEYPDEDDAIQYADEMDQLENYYIEQHDDGTTDNVIRLDIAFTETYI